MENELQTKLAEILGQLQLAVGKASDFTLTQLPDIMQSYVLYGRTRTVIQTTIMLALAAAAFIMVNYAVKKPWYSVDPYDKTNTGTRSDTNMFLIALMTIFGSISAVIALLTFDYLVWLAPKVWLLKELAKMIT